MQKESNILRKKEEIRKETIRRLADQDASLRNERSLVIQKKLLSSDEFKGSQTVMTYVSLPQEVDTGYFIEEALKQGKRVVVPYIEPDSFRIIVSRLEKIENLEKGLYGISQPKKEALKEVPLKEIDLIVVPAIAYDTKNMRLGRGKGYYDRFLSQETLKNAPSIGIAFHFQVLENLPSSVHDRPVTRVITDLS